MGYLLLCAIILFYWKKGINNEIKRMMCMMTSVMLASGVWIIGMDVQEVDNLCKENNVRLKNHERDVLISFALIVEQLL